MSADQQFSGAYRCAECGVAFGRPAERRSWFCGASCLSAAGRALAAAMREIEEGLRTGVMTPEEATRRLTATSIWSNGFDQAPLDPTAARRTSLGVRRAVRRLMPVERAAEEVAS